jgi:hypothetical protein
MNKKAEYEKTAFFLFILVVIIIIIFGWWAFTGKTIGDFIDLDNDGIFRWRR